MNTLKNVLCTFLLFSPGLAFAGNPVLAGDVLGRDLDIWVGGSKLGHVGVLSSSNTVSQVMNTTPYVDVVQFVTVSGFKVTPYWGSKAKNYFTYNSGYSSASSQITALSRQQRPYVSYNLYSSEPNPAKYSCKSYSNGKCVAYGWSKGSFRCDAFVKWIYQQTGNGNLGGSLPKSTYNSSLLTITR